MKIDIGNLWTAVDVVQQSSASSVRSSAPEIENGIDTDNAQLSQAAVLAGTLRQKLEDIPETRQARVEELRQKVQQGTYQVSSDRIANAMRDDFRGLNRITKG